MSRLTEKRARHDEVRERYRGILLEEYKIIQQKFDKIGDFQFRVKQWALTLFAAIVGAQVTNVGWPSLLLGFCGIVACVMFWWMEAEQHEIQQKLSARVFEIETEMQDRFGYSPMIAATLSRFERDSRKRKRKKAWVPSSWRRLKRYLETSTKLPAAIKSRIRQISFREVFYVLLAILMIGSGVICYSRKTSKSSNSGITNNLLVRDTLEIQKHQIKHPIVDMPSELVAKGQQTLKSEPQSNEPQSNEPQSNEPQSNEPQPNEPQPNEPQPNEPQPKES